MLFKYEEIGGNTKPIKISILIAMFLAKKRLMRLPSINTSKARLAKRRLSAARIAAKLASIQNEKG